MPPVMNVLELEHNFDYLAITFDLWSRDSWVFISLPCSTADNKCNVIIKLL